MVCLYHECQHSQQLSAVSPAGHFVLSKQFAYGFQDLFVNLLFLQLLICGVFFPVQIITAYREVTRNQPAPHCPSLMLMSLGTTYTENWASFLVALNRYVAIQLPHHYANWVRKPVLLAMVLVPWTIGVGSTLPVFFGFGADFVWRPSIGVCLPTPNSNGVYVAVWASFGVFVPAGLMGILYVTLFVRLAAARHAANIQIRSRSTQRTIPVLSAGNGANLARARRISVVRTLSVSFLW